MKIGEIAAFFHVSQKAIRIYEKAGILIPRKVDKETGYRYYTASQVQTLNALLELKALGFTLREIGKIMAGGMDSPAFLSALAQKRMVWQEAIASAENKMDAIDTITERIASSKAALKLTEITEEQRAWLLVKMVCVEDVKVQSLLSEALWL